jgi:hypothetical protein
MQIAPLTDTKLRRLPVPDKRVHLPDGQARGLILRVTLRPDVPSRNEAIHGAPGPDQPGLPLATQT